MKKFFVVVLMACMAVSAWAVDLPKQGFGFQIGWAQPILRLNSPSNSMPKDSLLNVTKLNGFKLGVVYDASFIAGFGSSIGIMLQNPDTALGGLDARAVVVVGDNDLIGVARDEPRLLRRERGAERSDRAVKTRLMQTHYVYISL